MIVPSARMLAVYALVLAAAVIPHLAGASSSGAAVFAVFIAVALGDAVAGRARSGGLTAALPEVLRVSSGMESSIEVMFQRSNPRLAFARASLGFSARLENKESAAMPISFEGDAETFTLKWRFHAGGRGRHAIDGVYLGLASPLGLWEIRRKQETRCEVRVYPNLRDSRRDLAVLFLQRGLPGGHVARMVGKGREFEKLREYVPGDPYEDIHWRSTAKRGHPVTKVYQLERTQDIYAVIDVSRLSARIAGSASLLETYLKTALLVGLAAENQGDRFGIIAFGERVEKFIKAEGGKNHFGTCRDALYLLESSEKSPDYRELFTFIATRVRHRAMLMIFADLDEQVLSEDFHSRVGMIASRHLVTVRSARPAAIRPLFSEPARDVNDVYQDLAGHILWRRRLALRTRLHRHGVVFADAEHEQFSVEAINQYLDVKRRQVL